MKDPAFLFYPNDYIGGTLGMTFEQKGAYIELLMTQFNRGHMTYHMIGQVLGQSGGQIWDIIKDKFKIDEAGLYFNERLEIEQNKRKTYTDSRKNNILGVNQHTKKEGKKRGHIKGHMTSHMENRNRNENIIEFIPQNYIEIVGKWLDYKKQKKQAYKNETSIKTFFKHLIELSGNDIIKAEKIIDQSIANNYSGIFELKQNGEYKGFNSRIDKTQQIITHAAESLAARIGS